MNLTPAELAILALVADGKSNKAIARERGTSPTTVQDQLHNIFEKLKVANRTQAAVLYVKGQI